MTPESRAKKPSLPPQFNEQPDRKDDPRYRNLGAGQVKGQVLPHQSKRKIETGIPIDSVEGLTAALFGKEDKVSKGVANGYAPLNGSAQVPLSNLPLPLTQANSHASPDTDAATTSLHHTIGTSATQAAAGNHTHPIGLFFYPRGFNGVEVNFGDQPAVQLDNTDEAYFSFFVPTNATSIVTCQLIGIPDATETIQFDVDTDFGAVGEPYDNNSDQINNQQESVTANQIWASDLSAALTGVAAGDLVGMKITSNTTSIYLAGLRLVYA